MIKRSLRASLNVSRVNAQLESSWWTSTNAGLSRSWTVSTADIASPDALPIRAIHRGTGFVTFHRKDQTVPDKLLDVGAVSTAELAMKFPTISEYVALDAYFSINSTFRPGYSVNEASGLLHSLRRKNNLAFLNAAYADVDCHSGDFDCAAAVQAVMAMVESHEIPAPSIMVRSGRGIWTLWLLVDEKNVLLPQRAWPEKIDLYGRVQRAIVQRLAPLGADRNAVDATRIMRVPGSVNAQAAPGFQKVLFFALTDASGNQVFYTLPQLANSFGVKPRKTSVVLPEPLRALFPQKEIGETVRQAKIRGCQARWRYSLEDFERLRSLRCAFKLGHRTLSVLYYTMLLTRNGASQREIRAAVTKLAAECQPPLPLDKALSTMRDALKYNAPVRNITIALKLGVVTEEERRHLPHWFRPARLTQQEKVNQRHNLIRAEITRRNFTPSCSQMALVLRQAGLQVTARQIAYDYKTLGLRSQARAGRPKKHLERLGESGKKS
jgi:hypothetical protein